MVEFYITNVCNLTCQGCNRFNNYKFSGFQRWSDYHDTYASWAERLDIIGSIVVLGGEPMLNPDFIPWIQGIRQLWPNPRLVILTNGYRIKQQPELYNFLLKNKKNTILAVGIHNKISKKFITEQVEEFLTAPISYKFNNDNPYWQYADLTDANGVCVRIKHEWWFHQGPLIRNSETTNFTLHQSDPERAHATCEYKKCHNFVNGKLYKCGPVALFPEFAQQHQFDLSLDDQELMHAYQPLSASDSDQQFEQFINDLPNAIGQCRFCPEEYHGQQIFSQEKKVLFQKGIN